MGRKKKEETKQEPQTAATQEQAEKPLKLKDGTLAKEDGSFPYEIDAKHTLVTFGDEKGNANAMVFTKELENGKRISAAYRRVGKETHAEPMTAKEQHDNEAQAVVAALKRLTLALEPHKDDAAVKEVMGQIAQASIDWLQKAKVAEIAKPAAEVSKPEEAKKEEPKAEDGKNVEPAPHVQRVNRTLTRPFTQIEKDEKNEELYDLIDEKESLEETKADLSKTYSNRIKGVEEKIIEKTKLLRAGIVEADIECEWRFNDPKPGKKQLYRADTNKPLGEIEDIKNGDLEQPLPLDGKKDEATKDSKATKEPKAKQQAAPAPEAKKLGDNGAVFVFEDGELSIADYEAIKDEIKPEDFVKSKGEVAKLTETDVLKVVKLPSRAGIKTLVRCIEGDKTIYVMWQFADAKERVAKAKEAIAALEASKVEVKPQENKTAEASKVEEPAKKEEATVPAASESLEICNDLHADGVRKCQKSKGHEGGHFYGKAGEGKSEAASQSAETKPSTEETVKAPEATKVQEEAAKSTPLLSEDDKAKGAVWCLTKCGIKVDEAEGALKRNGKLGMTQNLTANPHAQKFVLEQIEQVEVWVKEIQKEDAAKKQSAA